ncbi:hypothetical protein BTW10_03830 [Chromohalobacter japonicus]|uniref:Uncharacterized protein n=1 Tax=Chromohalobacter japonicus TaxID=223900 RepID=A0A1Q8TG20_9GAMM|nr:hypothetical protein [Chromohalobacter japonicus]OLO12602.1 hypothetical protein BTW10_03830 [Chromohalobacter japonicus]
MQNLLQIINVGALVIVGAAIALAKVYLPAYVKEKSKNLATKEDISEITDKVEGVKNQYSKDLEEYRSEIWQNQQKLVWFQEEYKVKVNLFERSALLVNNFNDKIVHHQIYASSRDIALGISELDINESEKDFFRGEYHTHREKAESSYLAFRETSLEMNQLAALLSVYFGDDLYHIILNIRNRGNEAIKKPLDKESIKELLQDELARSGLTDKAKDYAAEKYDSLWQPRRPARETHEFFESIKRQMVDERENC